MTQKEDAAALERASRALDALNFFLADVRTGLGPYLAVYLLSVRNWNEAQIGIVMSISAVAGILAETPAGALIDAIRAKRAAVVVAALAVTGGSLLLPWLSTFLAVALSQAAVSAVASIFGPAIAAISLGIGGHALFARRTGRNEAFNHAGNAFAAAIAGGAAYVWGPVTVFFLIAGMAAATVVSVLMLPAATIDHERARGLYDRGKEGGEQPSGFPGFADLPSASGFRRVRCAVPFCQRRDAPPGRPKTRTPGPQCRHLADVGLHCCGAGHHGPDGDIGRTQGQHLGPQAAVPCGLHHPADPRRALYLLRQSVLACRRAVVRRRRRRPLWRVVSAHRRRPDGRDRPLQRRAWRRDHGARDRRIALHRACRRDAGYSAAFLTLAAIAFAGLALFGLAMPETWRPNQESVTVKDQTPR